MSARSRAARYLEALLEHEAHGHRINVRWDNAGQGWGWHVEWNDGPTVEQVKAWAHDVAGDVAPVDVEALHYFRWCDFFALFSWTTMLSTCRTWLVSCPANIRAKCAIVSLPRSACIP